MFSTSKAMHAAFTEADADKIADETEILLIA